MRARSPIANRVLVPVPDAHRPMRTLPMPPPGTRRRPRNRNRSPRRIPPPPPVRLPRKRCVCACPVFSPRHRTERHVPSRRRNVTASRVRVSGKRRGKMFNSFNCSRDTVVCQLCRDVSAVVVCCAVTRKDAGRTGAR